MQQLWLAQQRIDSIKQLRVLMKNAANVPEQLESLCVRIVAYHKNGVLKAWLARQEETADVFGDEKLKKAITYLSGNPERPNPLKMAEQLKVQKPEEKLHEALGVLCGVPAKKFAAEEVAHALHTWEHAKREKMKQLKKQSWWNSYKDVFAPVKDEAWEYVVLNQSQLNHALELLRDDSSVHHTVYLCGSDEMKGKWYSLNLLNLENVTIRGIADPMVQYAQSSEHITVNASKMKIYLQDFVLYFKKRECVVAYEKNAVNYSQQMR